MSKRGKNALALLAVAGVGALVFKAMSMPPPTEAEGNLDRLSISDSDDNDPPYSRTIDFGQPWAADTDHNHCDARQDVLRRDLDSVVTAGDCKVVTGTLHDPYTGTTVVYSSATAASAGKVQVDHVVSLRYAWGHGAQDWSLAQRKSYASDPLNLIATTARANDQKSDKGPSKWMPVESFRCTFAIRYVAVLSKWDLTVTRADKHALGDMLKTCPRPSETPTPTASTNGDR